MRALERLAVLLIPLCLAHCTESSDTGEAGAPVPPPGSSAAPPPAQGPAAATGVVQQPPGPSPAGPAKPSGAGSDAGVPADSGVPTDAGTPGDAGKQDAAAPDGGSSSAKMKACADKCQSALQSCLTPTFPADGGLPKPKDPVACKNAFDACRAACAP